MDWSRACVRSTAVGAFLAPKSVARGHNAQSDQFWRQEKCGDQPSILFAFAILFKSLTEAFWRQKRCLIVSSKVNVRKTTSKAIGTLNDHTADHALLILCVRVASEVRPSSSGERIGSAIKLMKKLMQSVNSMCIDWRVERNNYARSKSLRSRCESG